MSQALRITEIVDHALSSGEMTQAEHDKLMQLIHKDGRIDSHESGQLSRIFSAVQNGQLKILDVGVSRSFSAPSRQFSLEEAIDQAINRDEKRAEGSPAPQQLASDKVTSEKPGEFPTPPKTAVPEASIPDKTESLPFEELGARVYEKRSDGPVFATQSERLLDILLRGGVWMRAGAMVGYYGNISFTREGITEHGVTKILKRSITGEGLQLTKAIGHGNLYLADEGKKVTIVQLGGRSLTVNGTSLLAFGDTVKWDITMMRQVAAALSGGLFSVRLHGKGFAAITTHFDPIVLRVTALDPVMTDANATVAWSGGLVPQVKTDISASTLIGRSSGETVQLRFQGDGFVVIQPSENLRLGQETTSSKSSK